MTNTNNTATTPTHRVYVRERGFLIDITEPNATTRAILNPDGTPSGYFVNNVGKVYSVKNPRGTAAPTEMKPYHSGKDSLETVEMRIGGRRIIRKVDMLVAAAFVPNPYGVKRIRHINNNTADNRAANLYWIVPMNRASGAGNTKHQTKVEIFKTALEFCREQDLLPVRRSAKADEIVLRFANGTKRPAIAADLGVSEVYVGKVINEVLRTYNEYCHS